MHVRSGTVALNVVRAVELSVAAGFEPDVDFLLGLPTETDEERVMSMKLADRLVTMGARIHAHAFMPLPGTPLRDATPEAISPEIDRGDEAPRRKRKVLRPVAKAGRDAERLVRARRVNAEGS